MDIDLIRRTGIDAAYKGAEILRGYFGNIPAVRKKGEKDLVTEADINSEKKIIETIRSRFPHHGFLGEEGGAVEEGADAQWIIDPLDGTTNFAHELPIFAVSIGFSYKGETVVGIVLNPMTAELYTAVRGKGAQLNDKPIHVSHTASLADALLATGFPYNLKEMLPKLTERFSRCLFEARGVRRLGSAAIDLCLLASGKYDGFWEENLKPWDVAAGTLIAREAGAAVTDFSGGPYSIGGSQILATNGRIHREMTEILSS
jgi:myo-inositol-1(or 4)-monophosphatase